ncbi:hypothetical protein [Streptomyces sp. NPDC056527]|uniref:hypothetical protein n=1 Tax=Streptomyces sp. NPDC056527 TaxID=3345853 RepID=UPI0036C08B09
MGASDLRKVVDALPELATRHGLQLISASVGGKTGLRAALGEGDYDADGVAQLAAACKARILYWDLDHLDADEFILPATGGEEENGGDPAPVARSEVPLALRQRADTLLAAARRHDGDVEAVRIAFVVEGVVHQWEVSASWAFDLRGRWEVLGDDIDQACPEPEFQLDEPDPREVERIAGLLRTMPAVISATSFGQRSEAAAEAFPAPGGDGGRFTGFCSGKRSAALSRAFSRTPSRPTGRSRTLWMRPRPGCWSTTSSTTCTTRRHGASSPRTSWSSSPAAIGPSPGP